MKEEGREGGVHEGGGKGGRGVHEGGGRGA